MRDHSSHLDYRTVSHVGRAARYFQNLNSFANQKRRMRARKEPPAAVWPLRSLEIGDGRQIELAGGNEGRAAPIGTEPAGISRGEAGRERGRVVARQRVAVALVQVSVRV